MCVLLPRKLALNPGVGQQHGKERVPFPAQSLFSSDVTRSVGLLLSIFFCVRDLGYLRVATCANGCKLNTNILCFGPPSVLHLVCSTKNLVPVSFCSELYGGLEWLGMTLAPDVCVAAAAAAGGADARMCLLCCS